MYLHLLHWFSLTVSLACRTRTHLVSTRRILGCWRSSYTDTASGAIFCWACAVRTECGGCACAVEVQCAVCVCAVRLGCAVYAGIGLSAAVISLSAKQRKDTITEDYSYQWKLLTLKIYVYICVYITFAPTWPSQVTRFQGSRGDFKSDHNTASKFQWS